MKEKTPLKFTSECPQPEELWRIINSTVQNVSSELRVSVSQAKLRAFITLLNYPGAYAEYKILLKETIDSQNLIGVTVTRDLPIPVSNILGIKWNMPTKLLDFIAEHMRQHVIAKYFPNIAEKIGKAISVSKDSEKILSSLSVKIDESLEPIVVESKEELKLIVLYYMIENEPLPPLQKKHIIKEN